MLVTCNIKVDANGSNKFISFAKFQSKSSVLDKTKNTLY